MLKVCPNCYKQYQTVLNRPANDDRNIQVIFPNAPAWQREQLISGMCSDKCWNELMSEKDYTLSEND